MPPPDPIAYVEALEALRKSDGWKIYHDWLRSQRRATFYSMVAPTGTEENVMRLSGKAGMADQAMSWVDSQIAAYRSQIESRAKLHAQNASK